MRASLHSVTRTFALENVIHIAFGLSIVSLLVTEFILPPHTIVPLQFKWWLIIKLDIPYDKLLHTIGGFAFISLYIVFRFLVQMPLNCFKPKTEMILALIISFSLAGDWEIAQYLIPRLQTGAWSLSGAIADASVTTGAVIIWASFFILGIKATVLFPFKVVLRIIYASMVALVLLYRRILRPAPVKLSQTRQA